MSWSDEKIGAELANTPARSNIGEGEYPTSSTIIELTPTIFWSNGFIAISAFAFAFKTASSIRLSFTAYTLGVETVKETRSTLFAPCPITKSIIFAASES